MSFGKKTQNKQKIERRCNCTASKKQFIYTNLLWITEQESCSLPLLRIFLPGWSAFRGMLTWNIATKSSCLRPGPQASESLMPPEAKALQEDGVCTSFASDSPYTSLWGRREGNPAACRDSTAAAADVKRPWQLRDCLVWMEALSIQNVPNEGDRHANVPQMQYQRELVILQTLLILPQDTKWKAYSCKMEITLLIPPGWGTREIPHTEEWSFSSLKTSLKDQKLK